jgi:RNA-directed DNA polymerase
LDHDLVVKTVEANTTEKWVLLYVKRWLKAPLRLPDGTLQERRKGTPQGSAVSPVLANLFLHYAFDMFLEREFPTVEFERYADDAVVHCVTERQARQVWEVLTVRLAELGLELHPGKTKIVYCGDSLRHGEYEAVTFTFLGYAFRPRQVKDKNGRVFASFTPAISPEALKAKGQIVRGWRIHMRTGTSLDELAKAINPIVAGWINYYGLFGRKKLNQLLRRVNTYLTRWARRKYKRLRSYKRFHRWWAGLIDREPGLFVH